MILFYIKRKESVRGGGKNSKYKIERLIEGSSHYGLFVIHMLRTL